MPSSPHHNRRPSKGMGLPINRKQTDLAVQQHHAGARPEYTGGLTLVPQPKTGPISDEPLVVEVKGIYAGLVMVEAKCIDIDETQPSATEWNRSSKEVGPGSAQWHALIALHKQLLHQHRPLPEDYTRRGQSSTGRYLPPISSLPAVDKVNSHTTSEFISPRERLKCLGISVSRSSVQSVALEAWFKITSLTNG